MMAASSDTRHWSFFLGKKMLCEEIQRLESENWSLKKDRDRLYWELHEHQQQQQTQAPCEAKNLYGLNAPDVET